MQLRKKSILNSAVIGPLMALIVVFVIAGLVTNRFLDLANMKNIAMQVCIVSLMAIGSTVVILTGQIDLSPGSSVALLTMILAMSIKSWGIPFYLVILLILGMGVVLGALNGALSTYIRIPSFIATLATMSIFRGIAFTFNNGSPVFSISTKLMPLFYGTVFGIPVAFLYVVFFFVLIALFLRYTKTGRELYAVGGNSSAARYSGINVTRIKMIAFIIAGVMSAISAMLMSARLNSGSPNYGVGMEMSAIAATVIGGTSLNGGHGNAVSTLIGALIIVTVQNVLNLHAAATYMQDIVLGIIIVLAVALDMWRTEIGNFFSHILPKSLAVND